VRGGVIMKTPRFIETSVAGSLPSVEGPSGLKLTVRFGRRAEPSKTASTVFGGMPTNPTWDEYVADITQHRGLVGVDREHLELVRVYILSHNLLGKVASEVANETGFHFSDGVELHFSWRGWGDLMQAIVGKREGYMAYYM
jgi:hypothetical protein